MASKLLLVDGHSILNRAFYGMPDLTNSEGLHTNAVIGTECARIYNGDEEGDSFHYGHNRRSSSE